MVAEVIDYRVSRLVVLCKDCGQDVGLYPARHKCGTSPSDSPPVPSIPKNFLSGNSSSSGNNSSGPSGWARLKAAKNEGKLEHRDDRSNSQKVNNSNFDLYSDNENSGNDGLWKKLRAVRNWKEVNGEAVPPNNGSKLWDKLLSATSTLKENISNIGAESDNESDKEGWEGETHISRILREYYEKKLQDLPSWLYSEGVPLKKRLESNVTSGAGKNPSFISARRRSSKEETIYQKKSFRDIYESAKKDGAGSSGRNDNNGDNLISNNNPKRKPRLWETVASATAAAKSSSASQSSSERPTSGNPRMGYQSSEIASSLPNNYEFLRPNETNNLSQQYQQLTSSSLRQTEPRYKAKRIESSHQDQFLNHRTTGRQYDDYHARARSVSPNPASRVYPSPSHDIGEYRENLSVESIQNGSGNSRSRGRSSNRQGGYF
ncbi:hypothetical protein G9A89_019419 [Geosiphon pyriformis]|nr:hypothetical protein G9A89_019419 [Geosiphon pyriformis]